jgi:hypothetical protein
VREVVDLEPARRARSSWPVVGIAALVLLAMIGVVVFTRDRAPDSSEPARPPSTATVLARFSLQWAGPWGIAYDGRDVWTAERVFVTDPDGSSRPESRAVRRNARTGAPIQTVIVPQESMNAIAADGFGAIYVAGGGDGGVSQTSVSKIDAATGRVEFTTQLTTPCSCQIVAGNAGVWMGANGSDFVLRLEPGTGKVAATVELHERAFSLGEVAGQLEVGLIDSRVMVVNPANSEVVRTIDLVRPGEGPPQGDRTVVAITPIIESNAGRAWATRQDGTTFLIVANRDVAETRRFAPPVDSVARVGDDLYAAFGPAGFDISVRSTVDATASSIHVARRAGEVSTGGKGALTAAGDVLWATDADPGRTTIVIRPRPR